MMAEGRGPVEDRVVVLESPISAIELLALVLDELEVERDGLLRTGDRVVAMGVQHAHRVIASIAAERGLLPARLELA